MFKNESLETVIPAFEDLSFEEMSALQGNGDVQAETTPACAIAATAAQSTAACGWAATGVATGIGATLTIKACGK
ncbi:lichenicidin A2 family type 2 lantibiotic [Staphylococcus equorum]|uniref:lichenicidin A2 family type 2 lantibiotic n=1 Tax=Staphylococcus equorum TaxID=246432 RepID=UPI003F7A8244